MVTLAEIETPHRPLGQRSAKPWPLAEEARQLILPWLGHSLSLYQDGAGADRYGRLSVQIFEEDGRWLQADLLRHGLARVLTTPDCRAAVTALLEVEQPARKAGRGLWGEPVTALRRPEETPRWLDSIQVVEGMVSSVSMTRGGAYLNFGEDWRRTLGVRVPRKLLSEFSVDPASWVGHRLRVRGWIAKSVGPLMEITHREQIEMAP